MRFMPISEYAETTHICGLCGLYKIRIHYVDWENIFGHAVSCGYALLRLGYPHMRLHTSYPHYFYTVSCRFGKYNRICAYVDIGNA